MVTALRAAADAQAQMAVVLANLPSERPVAAAAVFGAGSIEASQATEKDLGALRRVGRKLRRVFELGAVGEDADAVAALNALLATHPVQPRISGHDASDRHMHVTSRGAGAAAEYIATAVWGLSVLLCEHGSNRLGICAEDHCLTVYLDGSSNNCRRFCCDRCATRAHVAAHRARRRATLA
jgi:predicted RNA-binding Zn ribbon-like protein